MDEREQYMQVYAEMNGRIRLCQRLGEDPDQVQPGLRETRDAALAIVMKHATREEFGLPETATETDIRRRLTERLHRPSERCFRKLLAVLVNSADTETLQMVVNQNPMDLIAANLAK